MELEWESRKILFAFLQEALVLLGQLATLQMDAYRQDLLEEKTAPSNGYSLYRGIPRELLYTDSAGYPAVVVKEALQS